MPAFLRPGLLTAIIIAATVLLAARPGAAATYYPPRQKLASQELRKEVLERLAGRDDCWFKIKVTVSETGKVADVKVLEKYPKDFSDGGFLRSVKKFEYQPALFEGVPVESETVFTMNHSTSDSHRVRSKNVKEFEAISDSLIKGGNADAALQEIRSRYDSGRLSLAEVARYFLLAETAARKAGRYPEAMHDADTALMLHDFLEKLELVDYLNMEKALIYLDSGQPVNAIDFYDSWVRTVRRPPPAEMAQTIEKQRKVTPGRQVGFRITGYDTNVFAGNQP